MQGVMLCLLPPQRHPTGLVINGFIVLVEKITADGR